MMYDNRYRDANLDYDCGEHVIRLKTPLDGETIVDDKIKGRTGSKIKNSMILSCVVLMVLQPTILCA